MKNELRGKIGQAIIDYKINKLSLSESINCVISLFPPTLSVEEIYNIILETEAHSDTREWDREAGKTAKEIKEIRDRNFKRIREVAQALSSYSLQSGVGEEELGEFIRKNCSKYLIEEAYAYSIAKILATKLKPQEYCSCKEPRLSDKTCVKTCLNCRQPIKPTEKKAEEIKYSVKEIIDFVKFVEASGGIKNIQIAFNKKEEGR